MSNRGFGYWERCTLTVTWEDGDREWIVSDAVFTSADVGTSVRVGDLGLYRTSRTLVREGAPHRVWLSAVGYVLGFVALGPTMVLVLLLLPRRRRRR